MTVFAKDFTIDFSDSQGICTDYSGNIYLSDSKNHIVLLIDVYGHLEVYAGVGSSGSNGASIISAYSAKFNTPRGIACDKSGNIYVADSGNNQIRKISMNRVSLLAGDPACSAGDEVGSPYSARFNNPTDVAVDPSGNVYVTDMGNNVIKMVKSNNVTIVARGEINLESSSSSSFEAYAVGGEYWNNNETVLVTTYRGKDDRDYSWDGGSFSVPVDGNERIKKKYCRRVLIYQDVTHDGSEYDLNTPTILTPYSLGGDVPNEEPFVNACWNYYDYNIGRLVSPVIAKTGGMINFIVNTTRLYENLIVATGVPIPAGESHDVAIECSVSALGGRKAPPIAVADVQMIPKAYLGG